jgi:hypothetical protein
MTLDALIACLYFVSHKDRKKEREREREVSSFRRYKMNERAFNHRVRRPHIGERERERKETFKAAKKSLVHFESRALQSRYRRPLSARVELVSTREEVEGLAFVVLVVRCWRRCSRSASWCV